MKLPTGDIKRLLPHREPILLVDSLLSVDASGSITSFTIPADHIFVKGGVLIEEGMVEHFAQSAATRVGYIALRSGGEVPLGYIGAVSKCYFYSRPKVGDVLVTELEVLQEVGDITLVYAEGNVGQELVARCEMKIFLKR